MPLPVSGLVLGILSLGTVLADFSSFFKWFCFVFACVFLVLVLLKIFLSFDIVRLELESPVVLSSFGTFSMSLMLLSTYLNTFFGFYSISLWILGIIIHIIIIVLFTYRFLIRSFNLNDVYGTWWIVYVGISMAAITSPTYHLENIGQIFFTIGFTLMIPTLILVTYRYIKLDTPEQFKPFKSIYTALFSILIVAYISTTTNINILLLTILYLGHLIAYIISVINLIQSRKLKFYPSFAAFSFPFVISAKATEYIQSIKPNTIINNIFHIELIISITLVILITILYLKHINELKKKWMNI